MSLAPRRRGGRRRGGSSLWRPSAPRTDLDPSPLELTGECPRVDPEASCDDLERVAPLVASCSLSDRPVGHLPGARRTGRSSVVEVVKDRGAVDAEATRQRVDRYPLV